MSDKKFSLALIYDSGKRYIIPFTIVKEMLQLSQKQIDELEKKVLLEIQK